MAKPAAILLVSGFAMSFTLTGWGQAADTAFVRGDTNLDGETDIGDAIQMIFCAFMVNTCAGCADATDANDDGESNLSDPIHLLSFLFVGGPRPPAPGEACGTDPTPDDLDCRSFPPCAGADTIPTSRGDLLITPIEHASLVLRWNGKTIYVDPAVSPEQFSDLPAPDIVVVTHTHGDHMKASTLKAVVHENTVLVVPGAVSVALAGSGVLEIVEERILANGDTVEIGDIKVEAVPMYNLTPARLKYHAKGPGNGYVIDLDGTRIYISGDTEDIPEMRALRDIDLAFLCMNLPYTMTPQQAASAALEFQPSVVYQYHFRGQDPGIFKSLVEAESEDIEVRIRNWYP